MSFVAAALRSRMGSWVASNAPAAVVASSTVHPTVGGVPTAAAPRDVAVKALTGLGSPTHPLESDAKSSTDASPSKRLTTTDLTKIIAETHQLSLAESRRILHTLVDTISDSLAEHRVVRLAGLGSFSTYQGAPRRGINPNTSEPLQIPAKTRIRFRPNRELKASVVGVSPSKAA